MPGWHHRHNGHAFEQTQGDTEGQVSLSMGSQRVKHYLATEHNIISTEKFYSISMTALRHYATNPQNVPFS